MLRCVRHATVEGEYSADFDSILRVQYLQAKSFAIKWLKIFLLIGCTEIICSSYQSLQLAGLQPALFAQIRPPDDVEFANVVELPQCIYILGNIGLRLLQMKASYGYCSFNKLSRVHLPLCNTETGNCCWAAACASP